MRTIRRIIIHCSATPEGRHHTAEDIRRWHVEGNKWSDIGYHYVIRLDGTIEEGRPVEQAGAHTRGHNADSIGVCYVGGLDAETWEPKDTRTDAQRWALRRLVGVLLAQHPGATVHGHNEFAAKACPCFDVQAEEWATEPFAPLPDETHSQRIEEPKTVPGGAVTYSGKWKNGVFVPDLEINQPTIALAQPKPIIVPKHIRRASDIREDDLRALVATSGRSVEEVAIALLERVADIGETALGPVSRIIRLVRAIRG